MHKEARRIPVYSSSKYEVLIANGCSKELPELLQSYKDRKLAILTDETVDALYGETIADQLKRDGYDVVKYAVSDGEESKSMETLGELLSFLAKERLRRTDLIVALGGGVVGDLVGFAAGVYLRGVDFIQIPTSYLAAVDSSVGGKTAVNLPEGKNLVGLFNQPKAVFCDCAQFVTMKDERFADGVAESIKYGVLFDSELFAEFEQKITKDDDRLVDLTARCVAHKAAVVQEDEFDTGQRQLLNLGHTIGHALELLSDFSLTHGHAVAIGMAMMARAAYRKGYCDADTALRIEEALRVNDLPTRTDYSAEEIHRHCLTDKKFVRSGITIIVPRRIGHCELVQISAEELRSWVTEGGEAIERNHTGR